MPDLHGSHRRRIPVCIQRRGSTSSEFAKDLPDQGVSSDGSPTSKLVVLRGGTNVGSWQEAIWAYGGTKGATCSSLSSCYQHNSHHGLFSVGNRPSFQLIPHRHGSQPYPSSRSSAPLPHPLRGQLDCLKTFLTPFSYLLVHCCWRLLYSGLTAGTSGAFWPMASWI
jgi:hypothetical protein